MKFIAHIFNKFIWFWVILVTLIGYNGYVNPNVNRNFGDTYPITFTLSNNGEYEYYGSLDFDKYRYPLYNTPYRFIVDEFKFNITKQFNSEVAQWITTFLPLLISIALSFLFFKGVAGSRFYGFILWVFWSFSSFVIFSSSIHTPIIISLNFFLVFLWVLKDFLNSKFSNIDIFNYTISGSFILLLSLIYEMRIIIISAPLILCILGLWVVQAWDNVKNNKLKVFIPSFIILLVLAVNFLYIFVTLDVVLASIDKLTNRSSWGSQYFQFVNVLAIFHPFYRVGEPINFQYGYPPIPYVANIFLFFIVLITSLKQLFEQKTKWLILVLLPLFFFGFLAKQNNWPFENSFDLLYQYPYFSLSREASKYYYGYLIALILLIAAIFKNEKISKILKNAMVILILIPSVLNFSVLSSGLYGASSRPYPLDVSIYDKINVSLNNLSKQNNHQQSIRALWLPIVSNIQPNAENIKHFSYSSLISEYPLNNLRRTDRGYLAQNFKDPNFVSYLQTYQIDYIVLPSDKNEVSIFDEMKLLYKDFDYTSYKTNVIENLKLSKVANVSGYEIYTYEKNPNYKLRVVDSVINPKHVDIGDIVISSDIRNTNQDTLNDTSYNFDVKPGNCNNDPTKGLDFKPNERIKIERSPTKFNLSASANFREVPCIFIEFTPKTPTTENIYLKLTSYNGDPIELIMFDQGYPDKIQIKKVYNLDKQSTGLIPVSCNFEKCQFGIYLYGDKNLETKLLNFEGEFVSSDIIPISTKDDLITENDVIVNSITSQNIDINGLSKNDYVLLPYVFKPGYRLVVDEKDSLEPIANNHNLLLYDIKKYKNNQIESVKLVYLPEISVQPYLLLSKIVLSIVLILFIAVSLFSLLKFTKKSIIYAKI